MDSNAGIGFVREHGNALEQARLCAVLWGDAPDHGVVSRLAEMQDRSGGFRYWIPDLGNICDTAFVLQWLEELGLHDHSLADAACRFLLERQQPDGGWDEVVGVVGHGAPGWMTLGRVATRVWLTAFCAHVLICFGRAESPESTCPTGFLLTHADASGRLEGYLRATWLALPMFAFYPGSNSKPFRHAVAVVEQAYTPDWTGAYLGWLLRCLYDAGLPRHHPLVDRSLRDLRSKQRADGSWDPEEGEEETERVNATIAALRALLKYGELERIKDGNKG